MRAQDETERSISASFICIRIRIIRYDMCAYEYGTGSFIFGMRCFLCPFKSAGKKTLFRSHAHSHPCKHFEIEQFNLLALAEYLSWAKLLTSATTTSSKKSFIVLLFEILFSIFYFDRSQTVGLLKISKWKSPRALRIKFAALSMNDVDNDDILPKRSSLYPSHQISIESRKNVIDEIQLNSIASHSLSVHKNKSLESLGSLSYARSLSAFDVMLFYVLIFLWKDTQLWKREENRRM